jgi:beta-N-acetylhexosaminidase
LALVVVGLGFLIPEPVVFAWRQAVVVVLAAFAVMACLTMAFVGYRWIAVLFAAGALLALWQGAQDWIARWEVLGRDTPDVVDVARHFVVGYDDVVAVSELVRNAHIGGIFLTQRNVAGRGAADIAAEIAGLQDDPARRRAAAAGRHCRSGRRPGLASVAAAAVSAGAVDHRRAAARGAA